jgi:glycosyltransferase involved in cell wall biosynthesis
VIPEATLAVTTKNRKDELRGALASAVAQTVPVEVLVIDDGSTDGTSEMVRAEFPAARLVRHAESEGLIVRRNEAARLAAAPVVVSIDDDAAFPSPRTVEQTLRGFDHPRVGAVAIPFVNVNQDDVVRQRAPDADGVWVTDRYIGTAHAVRRDVFLSLGGYREHFVHQGEEGDFCLRMLAAGYVARLGTADPIHHFESPRRSFERMDYYGRRNEYLFAWHNVPMPELIPHVGASTLKGLLFMSRLGRSPRHQFAGMLSGLTHPGWGKGGRRPVPRWAYHLHRTLRQPVRLDEVLPRLPPLP